MKKFIAIFISLLLAFPSPAWAAARTFTPKIADFFGSVEFDSQYEEHEIKSSSSSNQSRNTSFREILNIGTSGFIYHPNLVSFLLKASEALEQEKFETNNKGDWRRFTSEAYEARAFILPTHPYNLEVFSLHSRPLIAGNLAGRGGDNGQQQHGAHMRYQKNPLSSSLNYIYGRNKGNTSTRKNNTCWTDVSSSKFTYLHGIARYADEKSSDGSDGADTNFTLTNQHAYKMFNLDSTWQQNTNRTGDKSGGTDNIRGRTWSESLSTQILPLNLQHAVSYSLDRAKSDRLDLPELSETRNFINSENMNTTLNHSLYRSVYSNARLSQTIADSTAGKNTLTNAKGSIDYRKQIYRGSFSAGVWKAYDNLDRLGSLTLLQEQAYNTGVADPNGLPGGSRTFTIADRFVDENTLVIKITDPAGFLDEEILFKNIHYTATTSVDTTEITISALPAPFLLVNIDTYTLLLDYSFVNTTFELESNSHGFSLQLSALDSLLNPHYSFTRLTQELVDGVLPGGVNNSESHATGITVIKDPYLAGVEYSRSYASRNSEKRWYGIGEYRRDLSEFTTMRARLESERTTYYPSEDAQATEFKDPERLYRASLNCSTSLPKRSLNMNYGVYYSRRLWEVNTSVYSLYSNLNWRLGKVDLNLGANYSLSSSTSNSGSTNESNTTVLYLKIKRKLF